MVIRMNNTKPKPVTKNQQQQVDRKRMGDAIFDIERAARHVDVDGKPTRVKHMRGPWKSEYCDHPQRDSALQGIKGYRIIAEEDGLVVTIAEIFPRGYAPVAVNDSNVDLMKAAPDMYAALYRMLAVHQAQVDQDAGALMLKGRKSMRCECGACDEARKAIAKAEGR